MPTMGKADIHIGYCSTASIWLLWSLNCGPLRGSLIFLTRCQYAWLKVSGWDLGPFTIKQSIGWDALHCWKFFGTVWEGHLETDTAWPVLPSELYARRSCCPAVESLRSDIFWWWVVGLSTISLWTWEVFHMDTNYASCHCAVPFVSKERPQKWERLLFCLYLRNLKYWDYEKQHHRLLCSHIIIFSPSFSFPKEWISIGQEGSASPALFLVSAP